MQKTLKKYKKVIEDLNFVEKLNKLKLDWNSYQLKVNILEIVEFFLYYL